jgi:hypothetical protein
MALVAGTREGFCDRYRAFDLGFPSTPKIFDIFEGTEQIQQLVISRAISGLRIE